MVDPYAIVRRLTGYELISPKDARLLTEAVDGLIGEIGSKDARIAELEAEVERLTKEAESYRDIAARKSNQVADMIHTEALASTGAVKVRELLDEGLEILNGIIDNVKRRGNYSPESTCVFIDQAGQCFREALATLTTEPAAPEGRQEAVAWQHIPGCGTDRESKMVFVSEGVFCDPCIAPLVAALNAAGIETVASCCGHDHRPGSIARHEGRCLVIARDLDEWRKIDATFPTDINGDTRPSEQAVTEAGRHE